MSADHLPYLITKLSLEVGDVKMKNTTVHLSELEISKLQNKFADKHIYPIQERILLGRSMIDKLNPVQVETLEKLEADLIESQALHTAISRMVILHGMMVATVDNVCNTLEKIEPEIRSKSNTLVVKNFEAIQTDLNIVRDFYGKGGKVKDITE